MTKSGVFLGLVCLCFLGCSPKIANQGTKISQDVQNISQELIQRNILTGRYTGKISSDSPQYKIFERLMKKASVKELVQLTDHENAVVRAYAFWALAKKKSSKIPEILEKHAQDKAIINTAFGDMIDEINVIDFMMELVAKDDIDPDCAKLKPDQIEKINKLRGK